MFLTNMARTVVRYRPASSRIIMSYRVTFVLSGNALLRRLVRIGVLDESKMKLDYVLGLRIEDFLERRLETQVFKLG